MQSFLRKSFSKKVSGKVKLVGVTILTSLDNKALKQIGFNKDVKKLVLQQAKLASKAKLDAIVCSAQEVNIVKKVFKKEIITPGINPPLLIVVIVEKFFEDFKILFETI